MIFKNAWTLVHFLKKKTGSPDWLKEAYKSPE
jgi:hypothetical protein